MKFGIEHPRPDFQNTSRLAIPEFVRQCWKGSIRYDVPMGLSSEFRFLLFNVKATATANGEWGGIDGHKDKGTASVWVLWLFFSPYCLVRWIRCQFAGSSISPSGSKSARVYGGMKDVLHNGQQVCSVGRVTLESLRQFLHQNVLSVIFMLKE